MASLLCFWLLPSRFPTFPVYFPKIFFHINHALTITNTTKQESAKLVKSFRNLSRAKKKRLHFILCIDDDDDDI